MVLSRAAPAAGGNGGEKRMPEIVDAAAAGPMRDGDQVLFKTMDPRLFGDRPMNLLPEFRARGGAGTTKRRDQSPGRRAG